MKKTKGQPGSARPRGGRQQRAAFGRRTGSCVLTPARPCRTAARRAATPTQQPGTQLHQEAVRLQSV